MLLRWMMTKNSEYGTVPYRSDVRTYRPCVITSHASYPYDWQKHGRWSYSVEL